MKEQPLFAPGDRVCCVDSKGYENELREGKQYTIKSIFRTPCCQKIGVSVGITGDYKAHRCVKCNHSIPYHGSNLYAQTRFVPIDFDKYAEETFHQSLKGKPVNA